MFKMVTTLSGSSLKPYQPQDLYTIRYDCGKVTMEVKQKIFCMQTIIFFESFCFAHSNKTTCGIIVLSSVAELGIEAGQVLRTGALATAVSRLSHKPALLRTLPVLVLDMSKSFLLFKVII